MSERILRQVGQVRCADGLEALHRDRILAFVRAGGPLFDRNRYDPGHLTASAFVVDDALERILLVHHVRLGRWLQPGGHGEPGEDDLLAIAMREAREETGIDGLSLFGGEDSPLDLDVHEIPERGAEPTHLHLDVRFLLVAPALAHPRASAESHDAAWFPLGESAPGWDKGMRRAILKIRARNPV
ncbi:MAG: NUDIX hydrolase [Planctomycetes bacterium]|nr:NUDIX hydrolase [Planctomycetota bacterium]